MCGRARYASLAAARLRRLAQDQAQGQPQAANRGADPNPGDAAPPAEAEEQQPPQEQQGTQEELQATERHAENLCPGMSIPVLIRAEDGRNHIAVMKWGLIPHYATDSKPDHYKIFNKRIESLSTAQSNKYFDKIAEKKRCVVILDGFYEWKGATGHKQPYYAHLEINEPIVLAGIFENSRVTDASGETKTFQSFAILTGEPSRKFSELHDRQPVLLNADQMERWLDPTVPVGSILSEIARNSASEAFQSQFSLDFYPVTKRMTNAHYQEADCTAPIKLSSDIMSSFFKPKEEGSQEVKADRKRKIPVKSEQPQKKK